MRENDDKIILEQPVNKLSGNLIFGGYMSWHGTPEFDGEWTRWNEDGHRPEEKDIYSEFWPAKGLYSSRDESILRMQAEEMKKAGIDVVVIFWNGVYAGEKQRVEKAMKIFGEEGLKGIVAIDFDWNNKGGVEAQSLEMVGRLEAVINSYVPESKEFYNDFYYRDPVSGLPVYMIYATVGDIAFWDEKVALYKSNEATNGIFICGVTCLDMAYSRAFDGIFWTGTPEGESDREGHEIHLNVLSEGRGMFYMGGLIAGFNNGHIKLERDCGYAFNTKWTGIITAKGKGGNSVEHVYVPYNDWGEGGSIEPVSDNPPYRKGQGTYNTFSPYHSTDYLYMNYARAKEFKINR